MNLQNENQKGNDVIYKIQSQRDFSGPAAAPAHLIVPLVPSFQDKAKKVPVGRIVKTRLVAGSCVLFI